MIPFYDYFQIPFGFLLPWVKQPMALPPRSKPSTSASLEGLAALPTFLTLEQEPLGWIPILSQSSAVATTTRIIPTSATSWMSKDHGHHSKGCNRKGTFWAEVFSSENSTNRNKQKKTSPGDMLASHTNRHKQKVNKYTLRLLVLLKNIN